METTYMLMKGLTAHKSVLLLVNGQLQTSGINYNILRISIMRLKDSIQVDTLESINEIPGALYIKYNKII